MCEDERTALDPVPGDAIGDIPLDVRAFVFAQPGSVKSL
jgi:hypothetical protein